jgi:hypothetical protein
MEISIVKDVVVKLYYEKYPDFWDRPTMKFQGWMEKAME